MNEIIFNYLHFSLKRKMPLRQFFSLALFFGLTAFSHTVSAFSHLSQHQEVDSFKDETSNDERIIVGHFNKNITPVIKAKSIWLIDKKGKGTWESEIEGRIGKGKKWLELNIDVQKQEAKKVEYEIELLGGVKILKNSDLKFGTLHQYDANRTVEKEKTNAVLGFESISNQKIKIDAYLYSDLDNYVALEFDVKRDFKLAEKMIIKPYVEIDFALKDQTAYATKKGLNQLQLGIEGRYLISKNVIPFIDVAYGYKKGKLETLWQDEGDSDRDWLSDIGIEIKF